MLCRAAPLAVLFLASCQLLQPAGPSLLSPDPGPEKTLEITNTVGRIELVEGRKFRVGRVVESRAAVDGDTLRIDMGHRVAETGCLVVGDRVVLDPPGSDGGTIAVGGDAGRSDLDSLPVMRITVPDRNLKLVVRNSMVWGRTGDIAELDVEMATCGELEVGDVERRATLQLGGETRVRIDDTGMLDANLTGQAEADAERVGALEADLFGGSRLEVDDVEGAGVLRAANGANAEVDRVSGSLSATLSDAAVLRMDGPGGAVALRGSGSSRVRVEDAEMRSLDIAMEGRSEARIGGRVGALTVVTTDTALVEVDRVSGSLRARAEGRSEIRVDTDPAEVAAGRIRLRGPSGRYGLPITD